MKRAAELGYLGMNIEARYGGAEMSYLDSVIVLEEIARASISFSLDVLVQNSLAEFAIETFGTEEQKEKYLPKMAYGELLGCFANSEPNAGSDAKNIITRAARIENGWLINGTKHFCTSASVAGIIVVFVRTAERKSGYPGITAFVAPINDGVPGLTVRVQPKIAQFGSMLCKVIFDNFVVGRENVLGAEDNGWDVCEQTFYHSRPWIAAQAVGAAQRAFDETLHYDRGRETFGSRLIDKQALRCALAELETKIESARLLTHKAASQEMANDPYSFRTASMAKYSATKAAVEAAQICYQHFGGISITEGHIANRLWRDVKILEIYEGPSEIQLEIIGKQYLS